MNMKAETTLLLANEFSNIIGIKEASGNMEQIMTILEKRPKDFLVISGDDLLTLPLLALGADGVISVTANAFPKEFSEMVQFGLKGDIKKAREIHFRLMEFTMMLFADGSPAGIKAALEIRGIVANHLRLPLVKVDKNIYTQLNALMQHLIN